MHYDTLTKLPAHYAVHRTLLWAYSVLWNFYKGNVSEHVRHLNCCCRCILLLSEPPDSACLLSEWEIFLLASCLFCKMTHSGGFEMESISKTPQPAVGLCSGNMKQLRKQASVKHTTALLHVWLIFRRISVSGNVLWACFQILSKIILSLSCLSTVCVCVCV